MGNSDYSTVRVKKYIKEILEKINNKSIASTIADLVEDSLLDVEVGIDRVIAEGVNLSDINTSQTIKLYAFQVIFSYWEKITPKDYQQTFSLVDFIDIDNMVTIDIYARLYTNTLSENVLSKDEKNDLNSLQYLRKYLFKNINTEDYEKDINNMMKLFNPFDFAYPDKDNYSNLVRAVMTNKSLQDKIKTDKVLNKVAELKSFAQEATDCTSIGKCANKYEFSNINISKYKSFKNTILYSSLHDYTVDHLDSFDLYSMSCMLHSLALKSNKSLNHAAYSALLDISLTIWKEFNKFFDDSNFESYLCGNLSRVGNNLEESIEFWLDYYSQVNPILESSGRLEFLTRTSMQILERIVSEKRIDILSNEKIKEKVAHYNECLSMPFVANFYKNECFWSSNKKEHKGFSSIQKNEGKLRVEFWSSVNTYDRVRLSYDSCTFNFNTSEFLYIIKHILFLHQQKEEKYNHIYIDCWSDIKIDNVTIQVHKKFQNKAEIERVIIFFANTGEIILDSDILNDFIKLSSEIINDKELNRSLVETRNIIG